ncbi:MAG TPA: dihydropyrimidinase [Paraburkholderia sp.]|nr:dihydropyrimidinase [Paraburkholderia sp.]
MNDDACLDLVVRNARIATGADVFNADIGIANGVIVMLGAHLPCGASEIDAAGRWVLPGGVDAHCHLDQPTGDGSVMADDFASGTRSAACGGTTTVIPFACQQRGGTLQEAVDDYHRRAQGRALIDYAFHLIVTDPTPDLLERELPALIARGYTSFKIYMTYDALKLNDRQILDLLAIARREQAMTMIHAENADCIAWLTERMLERGLKAPSYHALSRVPVVEREATHRAISLSEMLDTPVLIVHVSGREAIEQIQQAQWRGAPIYAETCPQYLFLTEGDLALEGFEGAKCICSPPPRDAANQDAVWRALDHGVFSVFSSDHAPFRFEGADGKKAHGEHASFDKVPNGIPGLETRLALLFSEGVLGGRIDVNRFVELTSTGPAKLYGLYPRKGALAIGADADLVIWDTFEPRPIRNVDLHHNVDYTPYEGRSVRAWPGITISRGETVWERDGGFVADAPARGQFLPCERPVALHRSRHGRKAGAKVFPWLEALGL